MLRHEGPWEVVAHRSEVCIRAIPAVRARVEVTEQRPGTRCVVGVVRIIVAAEGEAWIEGVALIQIQMILLNERTEIRGAHELLLRTEGILEIEVIDAELVRHDDILVVRYATCHPVVSADGLEPPDLIHILEADAVHLIGAVLREQAAETLDALSSRVDIRKDQEDDILLADPTGLLRCMLIARLEGDERISTEYTCVRGDGLSGGHRDVFTVHAGSRPDALTLHGVRHRGIAERILRQRNLHMAQHRAVYPRLLGRLHHNPLLRCELSCTGIIVPGDHRRAIIARVFTY